MLVKVKHFIQFMKKQTKEKTKKENSFNSNKNISGNSFFFIGVTKPNKVEGNTTSATIMLGHPGESRYLCMLFACYLIIQN